MDWHMKTMLIVMVTAVSCASCSLFQRPPATRLNSLSIGMPKAEAVEKMGEPSLTKAADGVEYLIYYLKDPQRGKNEYFVQLKEGKVSAFGKNGDFNVSPIDTKKVIIEQHIDDQRVPAANK